MQLMCQLEGCQELRILADANRHSILISGVDGCGKTYMARQYAHMLGIHDFQLIEPKVQNIKDTISDCYRITTPIVISIENLDMGMLSASYALLKFLEEPLSNVYIVVTCRNIKHIPDTIISRSNVITLAPPTSDDLVSYAKEIDSRQFDMIKNMDIWGCARTFNDVDYILKLNSAQLNYFQSLPSILNSKESISSISWKLQKYPDGTATPIDLVIRYIMNTSSSEYIWKMGHECLQDMAMGRISTYAILAKFLLECKYGG